MRPDAIARRYARALFRLAEERGALEETGRALAAIDTLLQDGRVARVLCGPVGRERKSELVRDLVSSTAVPSFVQDFVLLLVERNRTDHVGAIRTVFEALLDRKAGRVRASVRSAAPLSEVALADLTRVFGSITGKRVVPEATVDPELIAGVVVEIEGKVYDGSLRTQLGKLRNQMATGN